MKLSRRIRKNVKRIKKELTVLKLVQCISIMSFLWLAFCKSLFAEVLRIMFLSALPVYEDRIVQYALIILLTVVLIPMLMNSKSGLFYFNFEEDK